MTTLKTLADARPEILKAEIAALLHNLGKLNNAFILHSAEDAPKHSTYHVERVIQPRRAISIRHAKKEIESLSPFDLAVKLLSDYDWGKHTGSAIAIRTALEERAQTGSPPASADSMRRWLFAATKRVSDTESALSVLCAAYGACKLHDLLLEAPSSAHRYPYEHLSNDDVKPFLDIRLNIGSKYTLGELITLMWDEFHIRDHKPTDTGDPITDTRHRIYNKYARRDTLEPWIGKPTFLMRYLITSHGSVRGLEESDVKKHVKKQLKDHVFVASAYGSELSRIPDLDALCLQLLHKLPEITAGIELETNWNLVLLSYRHLSALIKGILVEALGDTRRPDNDITLQDYSASIASLYKASLAQAILNDRFAAPHELRWCLLHVSFDGLAFWGQAHHVTDLLGRRKALQDGLDAVRDILEVQYPLGNEVYRDEHGSVFVMPNVDNLLKLEGENSAPLKRLLEKAFDAQGIQGELVPEIEVSEPYKGKEIKLAQVLKKRRRKNIPKPDVAAGWWAEGQRPANAEICTVCGQRPVGYPAKGSAHEQDLQLEPWADQGKAEGRNICRVCLQRRGRRARDWARNAKTAEEKTGPFERTIWTDEVADDNGRFALVVGRFALDGWLDGTLIPTMLKLPSFARIRRCWDTTRQFWLEVQDEDLPKQVSQRLRLGLRPANVEAINHPDPEKGLGRWYTYEAGVGGRRLGLCWDPNDKDADDRNLFWTTDNLRYLGGQLNFEQKALRTDDDLAAEWLRRLDGHTLPLYEPGGYLGQERRANVDAQGCRVVKQEHFHPFVPLMIEPATFMALVPADKALAVTQAIKDRYDTEMTRVRDRLPLHLGLVFAPRRTPLAAVLEAGRAMLAMPDGWEKWQIEAQGREATFSRDGQTFDWKYSAKMGDNQTDDVWYPHLLLCEPNKRLKEKEQRGQELELKKQDDFCLVDDLTGTVFIRPSRFDFEFLDTTARRFEIAYQTSKVSETLEVSRLSRPTRPFLLDDLERLETLWTELCYLEKSQRHQVISTIEATREAWFGADREGQSLTDGVFRQFVHDTLAGAAWPERHKWKDICQAKSDGQLVAAGVAGELADLAELHMEILKE